MMDGPPTVHFFVRPHDSGSSIQEFKTITDGKPRNHSRSPEAGWIQVCVRLFQEKKWAN